MNMGDHTHITTDVIYLDENDPADRDKIAAVKRYLAAQDSGGDELETLTQFYKNTHKWNLALEALSLWAEWFEDDPYPRGESNCCVFCGMSMTDDHAADCIYIRAKKLIKGHGE